MSKDYLSIFFHQMKATVLSALQVFFATRPVFKIGEWHLDIPQFVQFGPLLHTSENI